MLKETFIAASLCIAVATAAPTAQAAPRIFDARVSAQDREYKRHMIDVPRPEYPVSGRIHRRTGSGVFRIVFNKSGRVAAVSAIKSTGHKDLNQAAAYAFYRWRCRPGTVDQIIVPVTFTFDRKLSSVGGLPY